MGFKILNNQLGNFKKIFLLRFFIFVEAMKIQFDIINCNNTFYHYFLKFVKKKIKRKQKKYLTFINFFHSFS